MIKTIVGLLITVFLFFLFSVCKIASFTGQEMNMLEEDIYE